MLKDITSCVAFDRKGTTSVITHQGMERGCSDEFANALCRHLNGTMGHAHGWRKDDGGIFTDSANYMYNIAECTNISCGYYNEHTSREYLDLEFVQRLMNACLIIDWHSLPIKRDPADIEMAEGAFGGTYGYSEWDKGNHGWSGKRVLDDEVDYETEFWCWDDAYDLACRSPEQAADLLWAYCGNRNGRARK